MTHTWGKLGETLASFIGDQYNNKISSTIEAQYFKTVLTGGTLSQVGVLVGVSLLTNLIATDTVTDRCLAEIRQR